MVTTLPTSTHESTVSDVTIKGISKRERKLRYPEISRISRNTLLK